MKYNKLKRKSLLKKPINNFPHIIDALIYLERNNRDEDVDEIFYGVDIFKSRVLTFFLLDDYLLNNRIKDLNSKYYYALFAILIKSLKGRNLIVNYVKKKPKSIEKIRSLLDYIFCNEQTYEYEFGKRSVVLIYTNVLYKRLEIF